MRATLDLLRGMVGLRSPRTAVTDEELEVLCALASVSQMIVEVGVSEGATSAALLSAMPDGGHLFLVDPYLDGLRLETWLGFSGTERIAKRAVRRFGARARFLRATSSNAARHWPTDSLAQLIFLDARHDHDSVAEDLALWAPHLAPAGRIAVHDCLPCASRPELRTEEGGCLAVQEALGSGWRLVVSAESLAVLEPPGPPPRGEAEEA